MFIDTNVILATSYFEVLKQIYVLHLGGLYNMDNWLSKTHLQKGGWITEFQGVVI